MDKIVPRLQVFEIDDQPWFPSFLRSRVQTVLTGLWTAWLPPLQRTSPATQTAQILLDNFSAAIRDYTVVDFCSGAGGPTPAIERALNRQLASRPAPTSNGADYSSPLSAQDEARKRNLAGNGKDADAAPQVDFVMTDLAPHPRSWSALSASRPHLHFIPRPVDATAAPADLLASAGISEGRARVLRTFHLSFHHFDNELATSILVNTLETADAIAIVELIERSLSSIILESLMVVPMAVLTPYWALLGGESRGRRGSPESRGLPWWERVLGIDWLLLVFTYLVPVVPIVIVFDGWMSSLRARTPAEIQVLVERAKVRSGLGGDWEWEAGRECHTWPIGYVTYVIGKKKS